MAAQGSLSLQIKVRDAKFHVVGDGACVSVRFSFLHLEARSRKRISVAAHLLGSLCIALSGLLSLLLRGNGINLFAGLDQAAIVLLLNLGANVVKRHEGRGSFEIIVHLCMLVFCPVLSTMYPI